MTELIEQGDNTFIKMPARAYKEAQFALNDIWPGDETWANLGSLADEAARSAIDGVQRELSAAMLAAFRDGKDFVIAPIEPDPPENPFEVTNIFEKQRVGFTVKAGPVEPGSVTHLPMGWQLYRVEDWVEGKR